MRPIAVCLGALLAVPSPAAAACWQEPKPLTIQEFGYVFENQQRRLVRKETAGVPQSLALSGGGMKAAYGAGLLVGWGETGRRPDFSAVTGMGLSALVAPLAFLGAGQDRRIADLFFCEALSFQELAERTSSFLDLATLEAIARKHETGGRLVVALPGSAARSESVWDIGAIAASRSPAAQAQIQHILLAAVDLTTVIDPAIVPATFGAVVARNPTFRQIGAGEPFLRIEGFEAASGVTYLIHNGVLFPDEGATYTAQRGAANGLLQRSEALAQTKVLPVVPAYDFFRDAGTAGGSVHIASPRPYLNIQPASDFDVAYMRALFLDAYRQGRMGREWRRTFEDATRSYR
ncbi:hypothetical protein [Hyphomicrobium sp. CS1GBMeth3]|uniref:hypothetical protein n=1 Tax=Hyphomicrobium sp. CS1GBMeth3 TaxID=1892845 RepID=UPI0009313E4D|nr:hypothetical protein [Hyphomicrobium sp. CS1GBMeth3]